MNIIIIKNRQYFLNYVTNDFNFFRRYKKINDDDIEFHNSRIKRVNLVFDFPNSKEKSIFHGGCLNCVSQKNHGIVNCTGCKFFLGQWELPNLFEPEINDIPKPPLNRVIRKCAAHHCKICHSTMGRFGFLRLFGKLYCDNEKCNNSERN